MKMQRKIFCYSSHTYVVTHPMFDTACFPRFSLNCDHRMWNAVSPCCVAIQTIPSGCVLHWFDIVCSYKSLRWYRFLAMLQCSSLFSHLRQLWWSFYLNFMRRFHFSSPCKNVIDKISESRPFARVTPVGVGARSMEFYEEITVNVDWLLLAVVYVMKPLVWLVWHGRAVCICVSVSNIWIFLLW